MAVGQHEAIAIGPDRILRIEAHDPVPDRVDQRRQRHRRAGMARLGLLDGVDGQRADRVDRQLIELFGGHIVRLPFLASAFAIGYDLAWLLKMPAELVAHGREQLVGEIRLAARAEPLVERRGEHMGRHALVDGGLDRPAAFAGIGHPPAEFRQGGILEQGRRLEIEQPGRDHAAAAPELGDVRQIEIVLIVLGIAQRRGFRIDRPDFLPMLAALSTARPSA